MDPQLVAYQYPEQQLPALPLNAKDLEIGVNLAESLRCSERLRQLLLMMRLQRPYLLYCLVCFFLSMTAFVSTLAGLALEHYKGDSSLQGSGWRPFEEALEGGHWQRTCWVIVSLALCAEVVSALAVRGGSACCRDRWFLVDLSTVLLTALAWGLSWWRQVRWSTGDQAEEADLPLLALRFALQPCRIFAAASMACQVQSMQDGNLDIDFDMLKNTVSLTPTSVVLKLPGQGIEQCTSQYHSPCTSTYIGGDLCNKASPMLECGTRCRSLCSGGPCQMVMDLVLRTKGRIV